jgi:hypothetical protein
VALTPVRSLLQQNPIIVDVGRQADTTSDISLDFVVGMFALAGVLLLVAAIGSLIVACVVIIFKRRQASAGGAGGQTSHTTLKI